MSIVSWQQETNSRSEGRIPMFCSNIHPSWIKRKIMYSAISRMYNIVAGRLWDICMSFCVIIINLNVLKIVKDIREGGGMWKVTGYPGYMKHSVTFTSVVPQEESAISCECMNKRSFTMSLPQQENITAAIFWVPNDFAATRIHWWIVCSIIEGTDL